MSRKQIITAIAYDKHGNVLSIGKNSYVKTHTIQGKYAKKVGRPSAVYLHAEIDALIRARRKHVYRMFVSRVGRNGAYALAKPCPICQAALDDYGVKIVEYTK